MTENAEWKREQLTRQYWSIRDVAECVDEIVRLQAIEEVARRRGELLKEWQGDIQRMLDKVPVSDATRKIAEDKLARIDAELKGA